MRGLGVAAIALICGAALAGPSLGQAGFDFMPDGGSGLLRKIAEASPQDFLDLASQSHDRAGWQSVLAGRDGLTVSEIKTLAGYLSVNFPLGTAPADATAIEQLPKDGKQLAIANCQTCHSIFSGYLMQRRDAQGWRSVFLSPFHRQIKMDDKQKETFALYSADNMPLAIDAVPPELRF